LFRKKNPLDSVISILQMSFLMFRLPLYTPITKKVNKKVSRQRSGRGGLPS